MTVLDDIEQAGDFPEPRQPDSSKPPLELPGSILAVDFGSVYTRVVVIDRVEGAYRLVARGESRTTDGYPSNDILDGFQRVLERISEDTGRRFLDDQKAVISPERADRAGVDLFAVTASIGRPLRAVIVGLVPGVSIASAIRAASGTYIDVAEVISLEDGRNEEERLNAIMLSYPDVIILTGGTEEGATLAVMNMAKLVRLAIALLEKQRRPSVLFSGNSKVAPQIQELFGDNVSLLVAGNVRHSLEEEQLESARRQLSRAFDSYKERRSRSFARLGAMSQTGVLPNGQSYSTLAAYLGQTAYNCVALIDIGSSASVFAVSKDKQIKTSIRTDVGLGHSAPALLENVGFAAVREWLPFEKTSQQLMNYALNKSLRPATVPMSLEDLYIEHALLKTGAQFLRSLADPTWATEPLPCDLIVASGTALTGTGNPAYDALLIIDAVQPTGVTEIQTDPYGLIASMGAIATHAPEAVVQLLEERSLNMLGTCITIGGQLRADRLAAKVKVTFNDGEVLEENVNGGHLWSIPLGSDEIANVQIRCSASTSVNGKRSVELEVKGGFAGLIVDARGRPITLEADVVKREGQLPRWVSEVTGEELLTFDKGLLADAPPEAEPASEAIAKADEALEALLDDEGAAEEEKPRRGRRRGGRNKQAQADKAEKPQRRGLFGRGGRKQQPAEDDTKPDDDKLFNLDEINDDPEDDELDELRNVLS